MKWWWIKFKEFFHFNPKEKKGATVLLLLLFFITMINFGLKKYTYQESFVRIEKEIIPRFKLYDTTACMDFNGSLMEGIKPYWVEKIQANRKKYGKFQCIEDLRDLKGIKEFHIKKWSKLVDPSFLRCPKIHLNKVSEKEFSAFFRIPKKTAKTAIKYRDKIGGFAITKQLEQVYYFPKHRLTTRKNRILINKNSISKINLKNAKYPKLAKHLLISKKEAYQLSKFKKKPSKPEIQTIFEKSKHQEYIHHYLIWK
ncbi:MAG: helix-hairpin-helix domain-containing protein [Flavobacteriales bacterium]|jgi:DNA uptake protein ComE-like DNA-binding protein|nr:helix-hairpin-helix domain-containing protein [Flavobacteriales bacterium]